MPAERQSLSRSSLGFGLGGGEGIHSLAWLAAANISPATGRLIKLVEDCEKHNRRFALPPSQENPAALLARSDGKF